jgi:3-dehydroquinate synthase
MRTIQLKLRSASSRIVVGPGIYPELPGLIEDTGLTGPFLVVSQQRILSEIDTRPLRGWPVVTIPDGERAKTLGTVRKLLDQMLELKMTRSSTVIALGGGVVGDVAGFAASLLLRGVAVVQVPTTLLAQVDSSVGGKTGVNHRVGKNLIGTFHQPRLVVADPTLLDTLPEREYRSGLYEVLKYGVIRDATLFSRFESGIDRIRARDAGLLDELVYRSLRIKARVVAADEKEGDLRRILNFGHTLGHAIEAAAGYRRIRHGEAVGYGMIGASRIAVRMGMIESNVGRRIAGAIDAIGPRPDISMLDIATMIESITHDKKVRDGRVHFVLPEKIGSVVMRPDVGRNHVRSTLRELIR